MEFIEINNMESFVPSPRRDFYNVSDDSSAKE